MTNFLPQKSKLRKWLEAAPVAQGIIAAVIAVVMTYTANQVAQANQNNRVTRAEEKIEQLEKNAVPRELFDERTQKIITEQERQYHLLIKLLEDKRK